MAELRILTKNDKPNMVIFIHGFIGGKETWERIDNYKSILDYLRDDSEINELFDFAIFDYYTEVSDRFDRTLGFLKTVFGKKVSPTKNIDIHNIAQILKTEIQYIDRNIDNLILITHSMGGLVAKSMILEEIKEKKKTSINLYVSLAVPHKGSNLAALGRIILGNLQIENLQPLSEKINEMNDEWINSSEFLPPTIYFQGKYDDIVPNTSSKGFDVRPLQIVYTDDNHTGIVHPKSNEDIVIRAIKRHLLLLKKHESDVQQAKIDIYTDKMIKFADFLTPDEIATRKFLDSDKRDTIKILWPKELSKSLDDLKFLITEVENYTLPNSIFYGLNSEELRRFSGYANSAVGQCEEILLNCEKRCLLLIKGVESYWGNHHKTDSSTSFVEMSLNSFLRLTIHKLMQCVSFPLTFEHLKTTKYYAVIDDQWIVGSVPFYEKALNLLSPVWSARCELFNDEGSKLKLHNLSEFYIYASRDDFIKFVNEYKKRWAEWYLTVLVPQIEFQLIKSNDAIKHNERVELYKFYDEQNRRQYYTSGDIPQEFL